MNWKITNTTRRALPLVLATLLCAGCASYWQEKRGDQAFARGDYDEAVARYEEAGFDDPGANTELLQKLEKAREKACACHLEWGSAAYNERRLTPAAEHFELALRFSQSEEASRLLGLTREAQQQVTQIVEQAQLQEEQGDIAAACEQYAAAVKIWADHQAAVEGLTRTGERIERATEHESSALDALRSRSLEKSRREIAAALELHDTQPRRSLLRTIESRIASATDLARKAKRAEQPIGLEEAARLYRSALEIWCDYGEAQRGLRRVEERVARAERLERRCREHLDTNKLGKALVDVVECLSLHKTDTREALRDEIAGSIHEAERILAIAGDREAQKDLEGALAEYRRVLSMWVDNESALESVDRCVEAIQFRDYLAAGKAALETSRWKEAVKALSSAREIRDEDAVSTLLVEAYTKLAAKHLEQKDYESAISAAEGGLEVDDDDEELAGIRSEALHWTHRMSGAAALEAGHFDKAVEDLSTAVSLSPANTETKELLARARSARDQYRAQQYGKHTAAARERLADGDWDAARAEVERAARYRDTAELDDLRSEIEKEERFANLCDEAREYQYVIRSTDSGMYYNPAGWMPYDPHFPFQDQEAHKIKTILMAYDAAIAAYREALDVKFDSDIDELIDELHDQGTRFKSRCPALLTFGRKTEYSGSIYDRGSGSWRITTEVYFDGELCGDMSKRDGVLSGFIPAGSHVAKVHTKTNQGIEVSTYRLNAEPWEDYNINQ